MSYAAPVIHYTFDTDGTNSGSLGTANNLTIPSDFSIDDTNQLIGTKCLKAIGPSTASSATTQTTFPAWTTPGNFTISLWGKCSAWTSTNHRLMSLTINGTLVVIAFQTDSLMLFFNNSNNAVSSITIPNTFDNAYHHFVLTFIGTTADLYIDNVLYTPQVSFPFSFSQQSITALAIGSSLAADPTYNGYIDDFRIYGYAADTNWIDMIYKLGKNTDVASLSGATVLNLQNAGATMSQLLTVYTVNQLIAAGVTVADLLAAGITQVEIDIALTNIKIHSDFTISDGTSESIFTAADAVYTPTTFAAKLTTDLGYTVNPITAGGDYTLSDSTPYYRLYLQFANAVTLTGMPKYIFNIPFSDFSVGAGGQVNLRNVSLDAQMTIAANFSTILSFGQLGLDIDGEAADDWSGWSVSLSSDGNIVAIGAPMNDTVTGTNDYRGHVRIYQRDASKTVAVTDQSLDTFGPVGWNRLGQDIDGEAANDFAGNSVALSSDGTIVAIGAKYNDTITGTSDSRGHVRVYERDASKTVAVTDQTLATFGPVGWTRLGQDIDGEAAGDDSGYSVAISADGNIVAIGAHFNDATGNKAGHVRIYQRDASKTVAVTDQSLATFGPVGWTRLGQDIDGEATSDYSGRSVALSSDGTIVAIGAAVNAGNSSGAGHVRVYQRDASKTVAVTDQSLATFGPVGWTRLGQDIDGEAANDYSGWSVAISSDGSIVATGAKGNDGNGAAAGHVRIYERDASKTVAVTDQTLATFGPVGWTRLGQDIDGEAAGDESGKEAIALSSDGTIVAIGAAGNDGNGAAAGHVRIYQRDAGKTVAVTDQTLATFGPVGWTRLGQDIDGEAADDHSGKSVALSSDGTIVAIGAYKNGLGAGHVQVYQLPSTISGSSTSTIPANNYFINNFVSTIETDLVDYTLTYDASNSLITFDGLSQDISMSITSTDATIFDTTITEITVAANTLPFITYGQPDPTFANYITNGMTITELLTVYTMAELVVGNVSVAQLVAGGVTIPQLVAGGVTAAQLLEEFTQTEIDIAFTQIKIHSDFTISDGTSSSVFATTDAVTVYTLPTFAAKLTTDLTGNTVTAGGDLTTTDSTPYYRLYLQFAEAVTLTGMPKYIFNIPFSDFSVGAGGQVNLRNVNLDAQMTIEASYVEDVPFAQVGDMIVGEPGGLAGHGESVALSADGNTVVIGSSYHNNYVGFVRIYKYSGNSWSQKGLDINSTINPGGGNPLFGYCTSISADGNIVAASGYGWNSNTGLTAIYKYSGTAWEKLGGDIIGVTTHLSGLSMTLSSDGNRVVIGVYKEGNGTAKIYQYSSPGLLTGQWNQIGGNIIGEVAGEQAGRFVAISGDGSVVSMGSEVNSTYQGVVRVYKYSGTAWEKLGANITGDGAYAWLAVSSLNSDGSIIVVGASNKNAAAGYTEIYKYSDPGQLNGSWERLGQKLVGENVTSGFGNSVAISADGNNIVVGAHDDNSSSGYAEIYKYSKPGFTDGLWSQVDTTIYGIAGSNTGSSVGISGDGISVVVGALGSDVITGTDTNEGSATIYKPSHTITIANTSTIPAGNNFINNFVNTIETDLTEYTLLYDASNALITFDGLAQDISMSITSTDTTVFDTTVTEITVAANTLPFITYGQPDPTFANYITNGMTITELLTVYTVAQLFTGGVSVAQLVAANVTLAQLVAANISIAVLIAGGITVAQLLAANISIAEIIAAGVVPDWNMDSDANHLIQSYVKDFIDISGSLLLRENANLTVTGNIETKGNITIKNPIMAADVSLNHNIFVGGDVSMNGNVTVGDVSMNGNVVDCSFVDLSIPESAINGTYGPDYTQPTIIYEKGFDTTADISMNANVQISNLKVKGNIEFSDGTTMDTYDDNIDYININLNLILNNSVTQIPYDFTEGNDSNMNNQLNRDTFAFSKISLDGSIAVFQLSGQSHPWQGGQTPSTKGGLLITKDGGTSWSKVKMPDAVISGTTYVVENYFHIAFSMSRNGQHMMCATSSIATKGGIDIIFYSHDYGDNWTHANGISVTHNSRQLGASCVSDDGLHMYINTLEEYKIYSSHDSGATWGSNSSGGRSIWYNMICSSNGSTVISGESNGGGIMVSTNYGDNFTGVSVGCAYHCGICGNSDLTKIVISSRHWGGSTSYKLAFFNNGGDITSASNWTAKDASQLVNNNSYRPRDGVCASSDLKFIIARCENSTTKCIVSSDYGATWTTLDLPHACYNNAYCMSLSDNGVLLYRDTANTNIIMDNLQSIVFKSSTFTSLTISNTLTAGTFSTSSDYRIKTDVSQLDETVTIDNLRPVKYLQTLINKPQYGLIAHELQEYYPDLVVGEKDGDEMQRVNYTGLVALLINEIKQLKRELTELGL
jgi:hypothetical protein